MASSFRIANFNVHNFNAPGIRFAGRTDEDGAPLPQDVYQRKVAWISGLLDRAKVDLITARASTRPISSTTCSPGPTGRRRAGRSAAW
jgi:hypothetical protein